MNISNINNFINIKVTNEKIEDIKGTFNIKLIKKDAKNEQALNDIIFDIDVIDENESKIDLINEVTGEKIKLEDLITGSENEDGVISIKNIKIEDAKKYTIILKERKNDKYIEIDPIEINIETISENNEYILGNVSLKDNSREDVVLEKENNTIILEIKNKKKITGTYNIKIKKINSISKEGLNGVKFHIKIYDNENNIIFDDDMITREINGNAGYIDINNRIIKEPGTHRCEITEIESLDGYKKFNQEIIAEIEVGLNDSEEKYEVKDVKVLDSANQLKTDAFIKKRASFLKHVNNDGKLKTYEREQIQYGNGITAPERSVIETKTVHPKLVYVTLAVKNSASVLKSGKFPVPSLQLVTKKGKQIFRKTYDDYGRPNYISKSFTDGMPCYLEEKLTGKSEWFVEGSKGTIQLHFAYLVDEDELDGMALNLNDWSKDCEYLDISQR